MGAKILSFSREARGSLLEGVRQLAAVVKLTLGPGGHNVMISRSWGSPLVTRDGVSVAKEVDLPDGLQNAAVQLLKQVAIKTGDTAGDGTTTATVLAEAIFAGALHHVEAGANPIVIARGVAKAVEAVLQDLEKRAKPVKGKEDIEHVATIAAANDPVIGKIIAQAVDQVGKDGAVTVEEGKGMETAIERIEGLQFDKGYVSQYFMNRPDRLTCELEKPLILVHEKKLSRAQDLVPLLERVAASKRPLLIIADDIEGEALAMLVINRMQGVMTACAVKAPGFGDRRKEMLEDIAVFTGAKAIFEDVGIPLEDVTVKDLGTARRVVVGKDETTIFEGGGDEEAIRARIKMIKAAIPQAGSDYDREKLQERFSKLSGGVAQINVGAATEADMKHKRARIEDALHAARAAVEEGILPGGGVALVRARKAVDALKLEGDEALGAQIVRSALEQPLRQIAENAGARGSVVLRKIDDSKDAAFGYDAQAGEYGDLIKAGILDPRKVVRLALQNAASMATIFLTTEAVLTEKEEPKSSDDDIPRGEGDPENPGMPSFGMPGM
ncbi:MAG TPA: chaperonin GroEL [Planctomycetota bacterium]|nr:chaperonin GroEL [Planctomycetota bacterium]